MTKLFNSLILFLCVVTFASCSIALPALVQFDNMVYEGYREVDDFDKLKVNTKIIIELTDSSSYTGTFKEFKEVNGVKIIFTKDELGNNKSFKQSQVSKVVYYSEAASLLPAVIVGAGIDVILIIVISNLTFNFGPIIQ